MKRLLKRFFDSKRNSDLRARSRFFPEMEALEDRLVPTSVATDMTQLAQLFPRHEGPTTLFLNFDGNDDEDVARFDSANRNQDIQDILYQTAQIFAPFDVKVRKLTGEGNFSDSDGNTTVFIGDNPRYSFLAASGLVNGTGAYTPADHSDFPGFNRGSFHQPNSDPFNIAFVDPVSLTTGGSVTNNGNRRISQSIAHEAGHTFGLSHVLTAPDPEIMSYDAANTRFIDRTYDITILNWNASLGIALPQPTVQPQWSHWDADPLPVIHTENIVTQNSFTYLQAVLGDRAIGDDIANVADNSIVDTTAYTDGVMPTVSYGDSVTETVDRFGDYDVFQIANNNAFASRVIQIDVTAEGGSYVNPALFVYDISGQNLMAFDDDSGSGNSSRLSFTLSPNASYRIVVGAHGGNTAGEYRLSVGDIPRYEMVLDMNNRVSGNNGLSDFIEVNRSGPELQVFVNGNLARSDDVANISHVRILGSVDRDFVTVGENLGVTATVDGRGGDDTLFGPDADNVWRIYGDRLGLLNGTIDYYAIENLVGGSESDTLFGPSGTAGNFWTVDDANEGRVEFDMLNAPSSPTAQMDFSGMENLTGSSVSDQFVLEGIGAVAGILDGAAGIDTLKYANYGTAASVDLSVGIATGTGGVANIENVDIPVPSTPWITGPDSETVDPTPTIRWTASSSAYRYDLWVDSITTGAFQVIRRQSLAGNSFTTPVSLPVGKYRAWVRALNSQGQASEWSVARDFDIVAPVFVGPDKSITDTTPTIAWTSIADAARYDLWVNNLTTGKSQVIRQENLPMNSFTPAQAIPEGTFRAWVRAFNEEGQTSGWSVAHEFTIDVPAAAQPVITAPEKATKDATPTIEWTESANAVRYDLWINNRTTGQSEVVREKELTGNSFAPAQPLPGGTYRVWVRAYNGEGQPSAWSEHRDFEIVVPAPAAPTLTSPIAMTADATPTIAWTSVANAARYDLWVSNLTTGDSQVIRQQNLTETSFTPTNGLSSGTYRVWVRALSSAGKASRWSEARDFTITRPAQTIVVAPLEATKDRTPTFLWEKTALADRYEIWVSEIGVKSPVVHKSDLAANSYTPLREMKPGEYRVWVRAFNEADEAGAWSDAVEFVIL